MTTAMREASFEFYSSLPTLESFRALADPAVYAPVPDGWVIGLADIVQSTAAIVAGRYKAVNTAAAAVIAAVSNALPNRDVPFVFSGDGASFALHPSEKDVGRVALASVAAWIRANLGLDLRVAMVPVETIRRAGHDLRLARFAVSPDLSYAMFSGGGLAWAEARMKAGAFGIPPAAEGERPDLSGLSCRFSEIAARHGVILSVIVMPAANAGADAFAAVVRDLLRIAETGLDSGSPIPPEGPASVWSLNGFALESRTSGAASGRSLFRSVLAVGARSALAYLTFAARRRVGAFDPVRYVREMVRNTDFRKFDDGLRMTLDCTPEKADEIETLLRKAEGNGAVAFGVHRQGAALMTCFVPSPRRSDHVHFVDGAAGGYAMAAVAMKEAARAKLP